MIFGTQMLRRKETDKSLFLTYSGKITLKTTKVPKIFFT